MRVWHEKIIPHLCRQHLLAVWRESLGAYTIITQNKKGYRNHPAVKEFERYPGRLYYRLEQIRKEMLKRGYNPKELPEYKIDMGFEIIYVPVEIPWQSLAEQIAILKAKGCGCKLKDILNE